MKVGSAIGRKLIFTSAMNITIKPDTVNYLEIDESAENQRLDNFLLRILKGIPKSHIYRIIRSGEVRVNKKRAKPHYKLQVEDSVRLPPIRYAATTNQAASLSFIKRLQSRIIYEDKKLLVINKPAGIAVHGGSGISFGVIEALRQVSPDYQLLELVHRLDRDTSGCLMVSKKRSMLRALHAALREKTVKKHYLALLKGTWKGGNRNVNAPLDKNTLASGERIARVSPTGKPSTTRFELVTQYKDACLVAAYPLTGRTHQIRVHATHIGHPIAGDEKYGDKEFNRKLHQQSCRRLFLHATALTIQLPDEIIIKVEAPLDPELEKQLSQLSI